MLHKFKNRYNAISDYVTFQRTRAFSSAIIMRRAYLVGRFENES